MKTRPPCSAYTDTLKRRNWRSLHEACGPAQRRGGDGAQGPAELEIADVCYDSRRAAADTLFVAVRGFESDGHRYIYAAAAKGAVCAVCEEPPECDIPYVIVPDSRLALALISVNYFRSPASEMVMMGRHRHERQDHHDLPAQAHPRSLHGRQGRPHRHQRPT